MVYQLIKEFLDRSLNFMRILKKIKVFILIYFRSYSIRKQLYHLKKFHLSAKLVYLNEKRFKIQAAATSILLDISNIMFTRLQIY
ncbi:hypothetical protein BpHYR1_014377 [Brachionus plicatilis]|uniref:Uncharacterized protein n=1 Tax=Brachionus plicatilis TaxID=10195 RepID=A0A3M7RLD8_BRAPC|nr:hypothetical protein BpHYR1_014377 [Brachionus plicatilis]